MILEHIKGPEELKSLPPEELKKLSQEIREFLIEKISHTGGHLASNLGVVELTIALHLTFNLPEDKVIWDVGHQSYTHKILTGRMAEFDELRQYGGLSGFPKRKESPYDSFDTGHSSTSISAGLGIALGRDLKGLDYKVVSVIGDGALTGGMAYEALNNAARMKRNFIIVLNDNNMSISENVGGMSRYLNGLRTGSGYNDLKKNVADALDRIPVVGSVMIDKIKRTKNSIKQLFIPGMLFENMGITYLGPVDGHNIPALCKVLREAQKLDHAVLVHVITKKGKGYRPAEKNPSHFHGVGPFDVDTGKPLSEQKNPSYTDVFSRKICQLGAQYPNLVAVTAAMPDGTGLTAFGKKYPHRFFDVGIAEAHAVTSAAGMAAAGLKPVVAVYSSFLQRAYDQILHDVCIQNLPVLFAVDRAGLVGSDGETHQGLFDVAMLSSVPGITVYSPATYEELRKTLYESIYHQTGVCCVRYPRGGEGKLPAGFAPDEAWSVRSISPKSPRKKLGLVTYGKETVQVCKAAEQLKEQGVAVSVLKLLRLLPFPEDSLRPLMGCDAILFVEEGIQSGGIGQMFGEKLLERQYRGEYRILAVDNRFVEQASTDRALALTGLDAAGIVRTCQTWLGIAAD